MEHDSVRNQIAKIKAIQNDAKDFLMGREVKIISQYNGQLCGRSKKPMTGRRGKIEMVDIDGQDCHVWITGLVYGHPGLRLDEVEFIR